MLVPFSTYLAPSRCDRNRPPQSQVARKLTPFVLHYSPVPSPPNSQPFLDFPELNMHLIRAHHKPSFQYTTQEGFLLVGRWRGPPSHGVRSYMTLILRSHVTLCSEKTRINIAVRGRVNDVLQGHLEFFYSGAIMLSAYVILRSAVYCTIIGRNGRF